MLRSLVGRPAARALLVVAAAVGFGIVQLGVHTPPAQAAGRVCYAEQVKGVSGGITYHVHCRETNGRAGGGGGDGGGGGPVADTCGLEEALEADAKIPGAKTVLARWCDDEFPQVQCWLLAGPYDADPADLARYADLKPPATLSEVFCANLSIADEGGFNLVINNVGTPTPLLDRAIDAYGNLAPPDVKPDTSPGTPSVVQLDTWFWLPAGAFDEVVGTPAEGMVAIATPTNTVWNPGDGSGEITCEGAGRPFAAGATSDCLHTYTKASFSPQPTVDAKGNPAYAASVTRNYIVRYEFFGVPVVVPGARLDFAVTDDFAIAVAEVQVENQNSPPR